MTDCNVPKTSRALASLAFSGFFRECYTNTRNEMDHGVQMINSKRNM